MNRRLFVELEATLQGERGPFSCALDLHAVHHRPHQREATATHISHRMLPEVQRLMRTPRSRSVSGVRAPHPQ
jgi:hypothetical protein